MEKLIERFFILADTVVDEDKRKIVDRKMHVVRYITYRGAKNI